MRRFPAQLHLPGRAPRGCVLGLDPYSLLVSAAWAQVRHLFHVRQGRADLAPRSRDGCLWSATSLILDSIDGAPGRPWTAGLLVVVEPAAPAVRGRRTCAQQQCEHRTQIN